MKIKINRDGGLEIERAGVYNKQYCPFFACSEAEGFQFSYCNDSCPHFGEPSGVTHKDDVAPMIGELHLCHNKILNGEIIDERKEETKND